MADPLPALSTAELELLLTALDPLLDGFGDGASCLDDARAYLERLRGDAPGDGPLEQWLRSWQDAGGNRATMRLMVSTLLAERSGVDLAVGSERSDAPWGDPPGIQASEIQAPETLTSAP